MPCSKIVCKKRKLNNVQCLEAVCAIAIRASRPDAYRPDASCRSFQSYNRTRGLGFDHPVSCTLCRKSSHFIRAGIGQGAPTQFDTLLSDLDERLVRHDAGHACVNTKSCLKSFEVFRIGQNASTVGLYPQSDIGFVVSKRLGWLPETCGGLNILSEQDPALWHPALYPYPIEHGSRYGRPFDAWTSIGDRFLDR